MIRSVVASLVLTSFVAIYRESRADFLRGLLRLLLRGEDRKIHRPTEEEYEG